MTDFSDYVFENNTTWMEALDDLNVTDVPLQQDQITELEMQVSTLNTTTTSLTQQLNSLALTLQNYQHDTNAALATINTSITNLQLKQTQQEAKLVEVETRLDITEGKLTAIDNRVATLEDDLADVSAQVQENTDNITEISEEVQENTENIGSINLKIIDLEDTQTAQNDRMDEIQLSVFSLEERVTSLDSRTTTMEAKVEQLGVASTSGLITRGTNYSARGSEGYFVTFNVQNAGPYYQYSTPWIGNVQFGGAFKPAFIRFIRNTSYVPSETNPYACVWDKPILNFEGIEETFNETVNTILIVKPVTT